jgi:hypothetical protein
MHWYSQIWADKVNLTKLSNLICNVGKHPNNGPINIRLMRLNQKSIALNP